MEYFKHLPAEITIEILSRLPTESFLECKLICRDWRNHVRHPSFAKSHLNRLINHSSTDAAASKLGCIASTLNNPVRFYYFEYNDSTAPPSQRIRRINLTSQLKGHSFVGSCHGLICFAEGLVVSICNPITREHVLLPDIKRDCICYYRYWTIGFGYVSSSNEYKVVGIYTYEAKFVQVYIYTLGSGNGWRKLGNFNFESCKDWDQGIFVDGALYWLDRELDMIITFDLAEENFRENLSPPPLPRDRYHKIGVLEGSLYIVVSLDAVERRGIDIWILKKKNDNHDIKDEGGSLVWSKQFRIDKNSLFVVTKKTGVLTYGGYCLNIYDSKSSTSKRLVEFDSWLLDVSPHKNT